MNTEAVIITSSRTALAKSLRGSFNMTRPDELAAHCIKDVLRKTPQLDAKEIEDVILGCGQPHGPQGHNVARVAAMLAGLPTSVAGTTVNRFCSSGLQAIAMAAHQIIHEGAEAAIGGGVESISMSIRDNSPNPRLKESLPGIYMVMGDTAEVVAKRYNISREAQDEYSLLSQQRTARAQQEGFFKKEIAPMKVTRGILDKKTNEITSTEEVCADKDECNRPDTTLEGLLSLKPHFDKDSGKGSVTLRQLRDPGGLQRRLRADGVPATVTFFGGTTPRSCRGYPMNDALINRVFTGRTAGGFPVMIIHVPALPHGAGVQINPPAQEPVRNVAIGLVYASPSCTGG